MRLYRLDELKEIAEQIAKLRNLLISPQAARALAEVSHGLPRAVKHHVEGLLCFFPDSKTRQLGISDIKEYLNARGIDAQGLGPQHRQYLHYLCETGTASLQSLALCLRTDCDFVQRQLEPVLLDKRLISIGTAGRELSTKGRELVSQMDEKSEGKDCDNGNG